MEANPTNDDLSSTTPPDSLTLCSFSDIISKNHAKRKSPRPSTLRPRTVTPRGANKQAQPKRKGSASKSAKAPAAKRAKITSVVRKPPPKKETRRRPAPKKVVTSKPTRAKLNVSTSATKRRVQSTRSNRKLSKNTRSSGMSTAQRSTRITKLNQAAAQAASRSMAALGHLYMPPTMSTPTYHIGSQALRGLPSNRNLAHGLIHPDPNLLPFMTNQLLSAPIFDNYAQAYQLALQRNIELDAMNAFLIEQEQNLQEELEELRGRLNNQEEERDGPSGC